MRLPKILVLSICYLAQVSLSETADRLTCTVQLTSPLSFSVLMHLAGFYYISAADVEARVLPVLDVLAKEIDFKKKCDEKKTVEACCASCASAIKACVTAKEKDKKKTCRAEDFPPCTAGNSACNVKQIKGGVQIKSVDAFCENKFGEKKESYEACKSMKDEASRSAVADCRVF